MSEQTLIRSLAGRPLGEHICWPYDDADALHAELARFFGDGLAAGERLVYFGPAVSADRLRADLASAGNDVTDLVGSGRLTIGSLEEAYVPDGEFGMQARLDGFRAMTEETLEQGYAGLRVCGEATALVGIPSVRAAWPAYELRADLLCASTALTAVCAYDVRECDDETVAALRSVHRVNGGVPVEAAPTYTVRAGEGGSLVLGGEIDQSSAPTIASLVDRCIDDILSPVVDVSGLAFADMEGVRVIASITRRLSARSGHVQLRGASPTLRKVWEILSVDGGAVEFA